MEMTKVRRHTNIHSIIDTLSFKAGIMEEMLEDTLDMDEDEELEDEADAEVDKVLFELTNGKLGEAGSVSTELPVSTRSFCIRGARSSQKLQSTQDKLEDEETIRNMEKYREQLNGLLSG